MDSREIGSYQLGQEFPYTEPLRHSAQVAKERTGLTQPLGICCVGSVAQSCLTLCEPMDCSPPGSCPWDSPGKNTGVGCHALLQEDLSEPGIEPTFPESPALQADSLLLSPWGSHTGYLWFPTP